MAVTMGTGTDTGISPVSQSLPHGRAVTMETGTVTDVVPLPWSPSHGVAVTEGPDVS